jgi:uncharacterized membrane protein YdbT with pleckstrin-like domain
MSDIEIKLSWVNWFKPCIALLLFFLVVPLIYAIAEFIRLKTTRYYYNQNAIGKRRGIFSVETDELKIANIEFVEVDQSLLGRLFNFGDVTFVGRGGNRLIFSMVSGPNALRKII